MPNLTATSIACANIAFIKYWGNRDNALRIPVNGSISINLDGLFTRTTVTFDAFIPCDELILNGKTADGASLARVSKMLDEVRVRAGRNHFAKVISENNFPTGAGIASSASAFAALALASSSALGLKLSERELSILARHGSGSACRSLPAGFVEWQAGSSDADSFASSIAPADHWDLVDCVAVISNTHKPTGSTEGHALAPTSPLQSARAADADRRLKRCREAIIQRDFEKLADIVELDSNIMHAVMMTSNPPLFYWMPATLTIMESVRAWRRAGIPALYTIDAGPNVHVITTHDQASVIEKRLAQIAGVDRVLVAKIGGAATLIA
jgi:diphosphomevalonate decarboxylase